VKKIKLPHIVVLISCALLILVGLQLKNAFELFNQTNNKFEANIENVLSKIAIRHEKAADFRRYTAMFKGDISGQYKNALKQEFQNLVPVEESVSIKDTFVFQGGKRMKYLSITGTSYDSLADVRTTHSVMTRDITELSQLVKLRTDDDEKDTSDLGFKLDKRAMNNLFRKSQYINEFMVNAFRNVGDLTASQRIDLAFLDSIISNTLKAEKLKTRFNYVITDEKHQVVEFPVNTHDYKIELDTMKTFKVRLFPGNIFDEELMLHISFPKFNTLLFGEMWFTLLVSLLLVILVIFSFGIMYKTILNQRKLAETKNDFISNMTHEFKTPISTISLACEALSDESMTNTPEGTAPFVSMIHQENTRLSGLVEQILQSALLDKGELKLRSEKMDLNKMIRSIANQFKLKLKEESGNLELNLSDQEIIVLGDPVHTANIITNLIDNAIKYSPKKPIVSIHTKIKGELIELQVADKGIGIKNEYLDKIFDKLYRIPTGDVHDVKGFGLGLSYVKSVADRQGWKINVKSKLGEGSTFTLIINKRDSHE
jgi:two-component system, OmpR family, phosphate regulon sensor histidine kinase PhoR